MTYCASQSTAVLEIVFIDGSYNSEVQFEIFDSTGASLATGQGSGSSTMTVNGVNYTDGDTIFSYSGSVGTDCDDNDASVYPGAPEVCNSTDDDCDGSIDEGVLNTYYVDNDGDGYGTASSTQDCSAPTGSCGHQ